MCVCCLGGGVTGDLPHDRTDEAPLRTPLCVAGSWHEVISHRRNTIKTLRVREVCCGSTFLDVWRPRKLSWLNRVGPELYCMCVLYLWDWSRTHRVGSDSSVSHTPRMFKLEHGVRAMRRKYSSYMYFLKDKFVII